MRWTYSAPTDPPLKRLAIQLIERVSGQRRLRDVYRDNQSFDAFADEGCFFEAALAALGVDLQFDPSSLESVPKTGPVLFVANHPFGVIDGLALARLGRIARPDVKVLAHSGLCQVPASRRNLLPVNFEGTRAAAEVSAQSRRAAVAWLKEGGAVGIFPGGGIATSLKPFKGPAFELPWHAFTAKMIQQSGATVVPIYFAGQNSRLFQVASHVSATLRLSLIFHETTRLMHAPMHVVVGEPIAASDLPLSDTKSAVVQVLRARTLALAQHCPGERRGPIDPNLAFHLKSMTPDKKRKQG